MYSSRDLDPTKFLLLGLPLCETISCKVSKTIYARIPLWQVWIYLFMAFQKLPAPGENAKDDFSCLKVLCNLDPACPFGRRNFRDNCISSSEPGMGLIPAEKRLLCLLILTGSYAVYAALAWTTVNCCCIQCGLEVFTFRTVGEYPLLSVSLYRVRVNMPDEPESLGLDGKVFCAC